MEGNLACALIELERNVGGAWVNISIHPNPPWLYVVCTAHVSSACGRGVGGQGSDQWSNGRKWMEALPRLLSPVPHTTYS